MIGGFLIGISKTGLKCQKQQIGLYGSGIRRGNNGKKERTEKKRENKNINSTSASVAVEFG